jgi:hypothetical protein
MAGINLSQSIQEKQALARGKFFDRGLFVNLSVFLLVAAAYGGSTWYLGTVEDELTTLQASAVEKLASLKGASVNRVADVRYRIDTIDDNLKANLDPGSAFADLERSVLPTIRITAYEYQPETGNIALGGVTASLRYLAQQMLALKNLKGVQSVHAENVTYAENGQIEFDLSLVVGGAAETP